MDFYETLYEEMVGTKKFELVKLSYFDTWYCYEFENYHAVQGDIYVM